MEDNTIELCDIVSIQTDIYFYDSVESVKELLLGDKEFYSFTHLSRRTDERELVVLRVSKINEIISSRCKVMV